MHLPQGATRCSRIVQRDDRANTAFLPRGLSMVFPQAPDPDNHLAGFRYGAPTRKTVRRSPPSPAGAAAPGAPTG